MKYLILIAALLLAGTASAQYGANSPKTIPLKTARLGAAMQSKAYTSTTLDTAQSIDPRQYGQTSILVQVNDSASVSVYYQPSYDGITFYAPVLIDSLSNNVNGGAIKAFPLPSGVGAFNAVRPVVEFHVFRLGVTSATYSAKAVQVR